jgi:hypothetical protein
MKILSDFKNLYKNTPILIMGCGSSVNQYNKSIYSKCITIGVNRIGEYFTPDFLLYQDDFLSTTHPDYRDYTSIKDSDSNYIFLMNYNKIKDQFKYQDRLVDISSDGLVLSINDENIYNPNNLYRSHAGTFLAISIALYMGSNLIGVIGWDMHGEDITGLKDDIHDDVFRSTLKYVNADLEKFNYIIGNEKRIYNLSQISHVRGIEKAHQGYIKHFMIK